METAVNIIAIAVNDVTIFAILQVIIFGLFLYSAFLGKSKEAERRHPRPLRASDLVLAYSLISASFIQAISAVDFFAQFKLGIILANLVALFYLCFFSPWFQGLVGYVSVKIGREVKGA